MKADKPQNKRPVPWERPPLKQLKVLGVVVSGEQSKITFQISSCNREEDIQFSVAAQTALKFDGVLAERPFRESQSGIYSLSVIGVGESNRSAVKTINLVIKKGKSRAKREFEIELSLYLLIWNAIHFRATPSQFPPNIRPS